MRHELSTVEERILLGAVADVRRLKRHEPVNERLEWRLAQAIEDARLDFVRLDAARWLGQTLSPSDRMMVSRAYQRLEKRGLAERVNFNEGGRVTHLFITPAGYKLARELAKAGK
jgi:hypothetical protein